jgi:hypothetical protein
VSDQPPRHVVGSTAVPRYPAGPNWSADPVGLEPPTGTAIDQMEPVGEPHEVAASLGEAHPADAGRLLPSVAGSVLPGDERSAASPSAASSAPSPPQKRKRRRHVPE